MSIRQLTGAGFILTSLISFQTHAESSLTGNITVKATVVASCQVSTTGSTDPLKSDFGVITFDPSEWMSHRNIDAEDMGLTVTCTSGNTPSVKMIKNANYDETSNSWNMSDEIKINKLSYQLFSDSSHKTLIYPGENINTGNANPFDLTISARMTAIADGNTIAAGNYSDTVQMTVDWSGS
ncbi:spore coat protein U domain-containing protein [Rahnella ecdela]|jgi:spore coat protein U-like protein|uniref:Spore coat protein U domain-containing protein n=1 Tax=Rahnella ecdela TaxID=2816250 RepID=A0ABS6LCW5_9GAMM|nr:spore coat protein U domain-containing protein [Rahnella ecdela]MBU9844781.1 spore coat protein U domain-containing protein [Rahnella ecdela]